MPDVNLGCKTTALHTKTAQIFFSIFCKWIQFFFRYFIIIGYGIYGLFVIIKCDFI